VEKEKKYDLGESPKVGRRRRSACARGFGNEFFFKRLGDAGMWPEGSKKWKGHARGGKRSSEEVQLFQRVWNLWRSVERSEQEPKAENRWRSF